MNEYQTRAENAVSAVRGYEADGGDVNLDIDLAAAQVDATLSVAVEVAKLTDAIRLANHLDPL